MTQPAVTREDLLRRLNAVSAANIMSPEVDLILRQIAILDRLALLGY